MSKKRFFSMLLSISIVTCAFGQVASAKSKDVLVDPPTTSIIRYSVEQIQEDALSRLEKFENKNNVKDSPGDVSASIGTFYNEWPVEYTPTSTTIDKKAFQIAGITVETYGYPGPYVSMPITYTGGQEVVSSCTGSLTGETEFNIMAQKIKAQIGVEISKSSTISSSISVELDSSIKVNSVATIPIYAWGLKTSGNIKYQWTDRYGGSGYLTRSGSGYLPYSMYNGTYITFGSPIYS